MQNNNKLNQQLFQAAKNNDFELFKKIIKQGGNPENKDKHGFKPAFYFILGNITDAESAEIAKILQKHPEELRRLKG